MNSRLINLLSRPLLISAAFLLQACNSIPLVDREDWYIVNSVVSLTKEQSRIEGNLPPWDVAPTFGQKSLENIFVSNSCGFLEVVYRGWKARDALSKPVPDSTKLMFYSQMGEWCDVSDVITDRPALIQVRQWNDLKIITMMAIIDQDESHRGFVTDKDVIEEAGWVKYLTSMEQCFEKKFLEQTEVRNLLDTTYSEEKGDEVCIVKGVYLDTLNAAGEFR